MVTAPITPMRIWYCIPIKLLTCVKLIRTWRGRRLSVAAHDFSRRPEAIAPAAQHLPCRLRQHMHTLWPRMVRSAQWLAIAFARHPRGELGIGKMQAIE